MIYLDNAASMKMLPNAIEVLERSLLEDFANSSSQHSLGKGIAKKIESCRRDFVHLVDGDEKNNLIFTSSATEGNNQIIRGAKEGEILYCRADHPSVTSPVTNLVNIERIQEISVGVDGLIEIDKLLQSVNERTSLVILTHVNGQTGIVNDVNYISKKIKEISSRVHVHVDGVQAFGKISVSLQDGFIDSYAISGHKIGGPKGVAGLFYKKGITLSPLLWGGGQEGGIRSSTVAAPLIFSFAQAARDVVKSVDENLIKIKEINVNLRNEIASCCQVPFSASQTSPYILTFIVPGISSDILMRHLEREKIFISSKSACSSKVQGKDEVFMALHIDEKFHKNVLRISFSYSSSIEEVKVVSNRMKAIIDELSSLMR